MKKALVLGALAFFAINIATVQNINAQKPKAVKPAALNPETNVTTKDKENAVTPFGTAPNANKNATNQNAGKNTNGAEAAPTGRTVSTPINNSSSPKTPASPKSLKTAKPTTNAAATTVTTNEKDNKEKPAAASWDTEKGGSRTTAPQKPVRTKSNKKAEIVGSAQASSNQNNAGKEYNQAEKNKTPEIGVPPTPKTKKPAKPTATPQTGTNK